MSPKQENVAWEHAMHLHRVWYKGSDDADHAKAWANMDGGYRDRWFALAIQVMNDGPMLPISMRLTCEGCGKLHIDEGEFATKPHHTHACQHCGLVWRPSICPTVGVQFLPGFKNE